MAKGSSKKPGDPKCRTCGGLLEGRPTVRIGGFKWHQECAEKANKYISREYREPSLRKQAEPQPVEETAAVEAAESETAAEAVEETVG